MKEIKHTELPWEINHEAGPGRTEIFGSGNHFNVLVLDTLSGTQRRFDGLSPEQDAEFIVLACNNFYPLVEALEAMNRYFESGNEIPVERATLLANSVAVEKMKAALKTARGET